MKHSVSLISLFVLFLLLCGICTAAAAAEETRTFTDDLGRTVELPAEIDMVIPSGYLALSVLIAYDPSYLASCGDGLPTNAEKYLPELTARNLPKTGALFNASGTVNYEEVMNLSKLGADVFIDVGQKKNNIGESLDEFTRISNVPAVFISQESLDDIPESYKKIGELIGEKERGEELYTYIKNWIETFQNGMQSEKRLTATQINLIDGNNCYLLGGFNEDKSLGYQSTALSTFADNIVTAHTQKGLGDIYGMEEIIRIFSEKDPDYIFITGDTEHRNYKEFLSNPSFTELSAVKNGRVYEIPKDCPYLWTAQPFSGWGICGMIWIANIMYPETFDYDAKKKVQEFYQRMIGYTLSDEEYDSLTIVNKPSVSTPLPVAGILGGVAAAAVFASVRRRGYRKR